MFIVHPRLLVCRTCLTETEQTYNIYDTEILGMLDAKLHDMISLCTSVQVLKGDGLPDHMCMKCVEDLTRAFLFREKCEKSDATLRSSAVLNRGNVANMKQERPEVKEESDVDCVGPATDLQGVIPENNSESFNNAEPSESIEVVDEEEKTENVARIKEEDSTTDNHCEISTDAVQTEFFKCNQCGLSFNNKLSRDEHICNKNPVQDDVQKPEEQMEAVCQDCPVCSEKFSSKHLLAEHVPVHKSELNKPKVHNRPKYSCTICHKQVTSLSRHMVVHTGEKIPCNVCGKGFTRSHSMKQHMLSHEGKQPDKTHICKVCAKGFSTSAQLREHERIHTNDKPFLCSTCGRRFLKKLALSMHMAMHSGAKPYQCDVCEKRFCHEENLMQHKKSHDRGKPYKCEDCDKRFMMPCLLKAHARLHTGERPFACGTCDKRFPRKSSLVSHMQSHAADKRYKCDQCRWSFGSKSTLINHIRIHTGEKPFVCEICSDSFRQLTVLKTHQKLVHKKK